LLVSRHRLWFLLLRVHLLWGLWFQGLILSSLILILVTVQSLLVMPAWLMFWFCRAVVAEGAVQVARELVAAVPADGFALQTFLLRLEQQLLR
jgi:hypothetical protein